MTNDQLEIEIRKINETLQTLVSLLAPKNSPCSYTFFSWLKEWFETYKKPKLCSNSLSEIEVCIRLHIKPNIEDKPLNEVTGLDVQKCLNAIRRSRTKKYTYHVLNGALKQAYRLKLIPEDIMLSVEPVSHQYETGDALTKEEQRQFNNAIETNPLRPIYEFYLFSGCRRSEATSLKWIDVDFKNKRIRIPGTKTKSSDRFLPLFPEIETILQRLPKTSEYVFATTWNAVACNFKRLKEKYGFTFRLHDFRHTFATRCLENGISMKTIQKWLGHSRLETTSNIYTHVSTAFELEEIAKFNPKI